MSDLIDLNSSDTNKVLRKELASPLIPPPAGSGSDELSLVTNDVPSLIAGEKRNSFDNNPFDQVLKETAEYVRKKEDPFEMVLEKVSSSKKSKRHSVEFKDDFIPKHTRYGQVLKINKTLDDSMIVSDLNISCLGEGSIIQDLNNTDLLNDNNVPRISFHSASPLNKSILNYSAMNDSLTESNTNAKENAIRSLVAHRVSMCIQKGIMEAEGILNPNQHLKLINCRRSLSQSDKLSPKKFEFRQRSRSTMDTKKKSSRSEKSTLSSMPSIEFDDQMNKAFLQEQYSIDSSVFFDLSNISEITRLASVSSAYNSSISLFSNGSMNQAFLRSGSSSQILPAITRKSFRSNSTSTIGSMSSSENVRDNISDLREKFKALKMKLSESSASESDKREISELSEKFQELKFNMNKGEENSTEEIKFEVECEVVKEENKQEKLIDVDDFVPSNETKSSRSKSSLSDSSSDSVFTKSEVDKSILSEARKLAKTFEEMADDKSNSSGYDLLSNHTQFDFDQLPISDDEIIDNNLIDLPPSPSKPEVPPNSPIESESPPPNESQKEIDRVKEIEKEFMEPKDPEKKMITTSLLLELEKLIKTEKNPDAEKLLNELEKVLGVKLKNNTDLLETCLQNVRSNRQIDKDNTQKKDVENKILENKEEGDALKVESSSEKLVSDDLAVSQVALRNNVQSSKKSLKSQILGMRKRFSSDPNTLNSALENKPVDSTSSSLKKSSSSKELGDKVISAPELQKSTISSMANAMRNKLKKKSDTGISKKGPMKATVPFGNMQRRGSFGKKVVPVAAPETPRKSEEPSVFTVRSSTPNSSITPLIFKKSKSKPVASSTPDNKEPKTPIIKPPTSRKRNFSCNISPVPAFSRSVHEKLGLKESPKGSKMNASPPKKPSTPKARRPSRTPSGIPKYSPRSGMQRRRSLNDLVKSTIRSESPQSVPHVSTLRKTSISARHSESPQLIPNASSFRKTPNSAKKVEHEPPKSPLKNINKMNLKVKPLKLGSRLPRCGSEYSEAEKENYS